MRCNRARMRAWEQMLILKTIQTWEKCIVSCGQNELQITVPEMNDCKTFREVAILCKFLGQALYLIDEDTGVQRGQYSCYNICIPEQSTATISFLPRVITFFTPRDKDLYNTLGNAFKNVLFRTVISVKVANRVLKLVSVFACLINYNLFKSAPISNCCGMHLRLKLFF